VTRISKVSIICTVKNEKSSIDDLLRSIVKQSRFPDEVVIVDGGSSDGTLSVIQDYMTCLPIRLITLPGANIAQGRNVAIKNASYDLIASTDGGCRLDQNWLENIIEPIQKDSAVDVVSGIYSPWCTNEFEELASQLMFFPDSDKVKIDNFLPSARSIAFRRNVWSKVGGYPEWLVTAEDTLFDINLKRAGASFAIAKEALVYWKVKGTLSGIYKQYFNYAKGDGFAFLFPANYAAPYLILIFFVFLIAIDYRNIFLWPAIFSFIAAAFSIRYLRKIKRFSFKRFLTALGISLAMELGTDLGFLAGLLKHISFFKFNRKMKK